MLNKFTPIDQLLKAAKRGEIFILVDDERRENELREKVCACNLLF